MIAGIAITFFIAIWCAWSLVDSHRRAASNSQHSPSPLFQSPVGGI